jgi:two-component system, LytTR family, response regulator
MTEPTTLILASASTGDAVCRAMKVLGWTARIVCYSSVAEAMRNVESDGAATFIIEADGQAGDGFRLLERIREVRAGTQGMGSIVFGRTPDLALKAFELEASDYLMLPLDTSRLMTALQKLHNVIDRSQLEALNIRLQRVLDAVIPADDRRRRGRAGTGRTYVERIGVRVGNRWVVVRAADIRCITGAGVYVRISASGQSYLLRATMAEVEAKLDPDRFVRIHRSTIVNTDHLKEVCPHRHGEYVVVMEDGSRLKASRSYGDRIRQIVDTVG